MKLTAALAFLLLAATANAQIGDRVVMIKNESPVMAAAITKAHASLDTFLATHAKPPAGADMFRLKVKITDENGSEHMWVMPFKQTSSGFSGTIANDPEIVESVENGEEITFKRADISDWGYVQNGKQKGSFTVCAMFNTMPANVVKQYREQHGFEC
ncbi:DUF2314 domain-containing protein [Massilia sp. CCM 8695]|uniref:DUF2314 domain-containing protein n=1 Tax=Massilia frigida TaxID=2609281 RepID=A0ABX0N1X2_9BURK|nr:DUF2314 domain-containing protein [Massilia frigida]NHZ79047.1 DUF2314 domain-containing protein [Massilia frigida]